MCALLQVRFPVPGVPHSGDHLLRDDHSPLLLSPLCRGNKFNRICRLELKKFASSNFGGFFHQIKVRQPKGRTDSMQGVSEN
jgi:hypothetical protein